MRGEYSWIIGVAVLIVIIIISISYFISTRREKAKVIDFELEEEHEIDVLLERYKSKNREKIFRVATLISLISLGGFALVKLLPEILKRIHLWIIAITIPIVVVIISIVYFMYKRRGRARVIRFELEKYNT